MLSPFFIFIRVPTLLAIWWLRFRRESLKPAHREPPSFIVYRLDSLGDVVLTTPLFRALKQAIPRSRCTVVVQSEYRSLLATNPHIDEILAVPQSDQEWLPRGVRRLLTGFRFYRRELRHRHFDVAISPRWDVDEHLATLLCVLTNATKRVGYGCRTSVRKESANRGFDLAFDVCLPPGPVQHEVERNLAIAEALGAAVYDRRLDIPITDTDRRAASKLLRNVVAGCRLVAVGIGAASAGRRWPLKGYAETLNRLAKVNNVWPVIVCSGDELGDALKLSGRLEKQAILVSGAPLREVCAVLERCELFIGNDSGCAHLAAAMGCSTVTISRHPRRGDVPPRVQGQWPRMHFPTATSWRRHR